MMEKGAVKPQQQYEEVKMETQKPLVAQSGKLVHSLEDDQIDESAEGHLTEPLKQDEAVSSESESSFTSAELITDEESTDERDAEESVKHDCSSHDAKLGAESLKFDSSGNNAELTAESGNEAELAAESVKHDRSGNDAALAADSVNHDKTANVETETEPYDHSDSEKGVNSGGGKAEVESVKHDKLSKKDKLAQLVKQETVEAAQKYRDVFIANLSDAERYSYMSLCAVLLFRLFEDLPRDRDFKMDFIKCLGKHLQVPNQVLLSSQALQHGLGMDRPDPFAEVILQISVIKEHGAAILLYDLVVVSIQQGCYDSRARVLLRAVSECVGVEWDVVESLEDNAVHSFEEEEHHQTEEEKAEQEQKEKNKKRKRYVMIGLATVGGGALLGLTGGLAAPFLAAGAGAVIGTAGATALGSAAGVAIISSLFSAAGAGLGGYKMSKRVGEIEEFTFEPLTEGNQLHVTIAVSGWLVEHQEFKHTWLSLANSQEQYVLKYESKYLRELGKSLDYVLSFALSTAAQEVLKYTVLSSLMAAITWPVAVLSAATVIDNPWGVCTQRAVAAGKILADVLYTRQQGKRPVTLIGFSLGARVIFYCLQELSKRKNSMGIVEDAILLGAPVTGDSKKWEEFGGVVAGRLVNGYCKGDWLLRYVYRTTSVQMSIAGLYPIEWNNRRMQNVDLGSIVNGHLDYVKNMDAILEAVGVRTREYSLGGREDSLRQWVQIQRGQRSTHMKSSESSDQVTISDRMKDVQITRTAQSVPDDLGSCGSDGATKSLD
ncbi:Transmembrane and coiled-coil domain-containing protein 4 [Lamellibrachia satsuma]|nr:Transmembrane and coiled-coil domain-containing protein 4 [Lamellibrachia satsuma]